VVYGE